MNNKIVIAIVIILLLAGGWYYQNNSGSNTLRGGMMGGNSMMGTVEGNLADLFASGESMECTFSHISEFGDTAGVVYIDGENMRGDFEVVTADGETSQSHMIRMGDTSYVWSSELEQGYKTTISFDDSMMEGDSMMRDDDALEVEAFDVQNQDVAYDCKRWTGSDAVFTPPSDIEFIDMSAQMERMQDEVEETTEGTVKLPCHECDDLTGDFRNQCRQALGCS